MYLKDKRRRQPSGKAVTLTMVITERLAQLRRSMAQRGMDGYVVVTDDFHGSEYVGDYFKARAYLSGFTGSAGTLVVLPDRAALWTDGRYFLQAADQLAGSGIELMRMGQPNVPTIPAFLAEQLPEGGALGFDGRTVSSSFARTMEKALAAKHVRFTGEQDLVDGVWPDRPALSDKPVWELTGCGLTRSEKLATLREKMAESDAAYLLLTSLTEIAWTLNLRGGDVACTPVFLSFLLIGREDAQLCIQPQAVSADIGAKLAADGVAMRPYSGIYDILRALPAGTRVMADSATANYRIMESLSQAAVLDQPSPAILMKACKTREEVDNFRAAHVKDGAALCRFLHWIKTHVGKEPITELSAAAKLAAFRAQQPDFLDLSFDTIAGYGPHGAIVHYDPTPETDVPLHAEGLLLLDSGAHYRQGTTDVTRTIALGPVTDEEKRMFTLVLKGHLALSAARFPHGATGENLDVLARMPLWEQGLDYNHGTGHGVGYILSVHEGPQSFRWHSLDGRRYPLEEGMVISNEPGYYEAGKFGIRHENLVLVRTGDKTEFGQFMYLEPLTMAPFDRDAIDTSLLTEGELAQLNDYHRQVYATVSPLLDAEEQAWLAEATAPLTR